MTRTLDNVSLIAVSLVAFCVVALVAVSASASEPVPPSGALTIELTLSSEEPEGEAAPRPAMVRASAADGDVVAQEMTVPVVARLELAEGVWELDFASEGLWIEPATVYVTAEGAHLARQAVRLGRVTVEVAENGLAGTSRATVGFRRSTSEPGEGFVDSRRLPCVAARARAGSVRLECPVPEGEHDLRLDVEGFVPRYHWRVGVGPSPVHLGDWTLLEGASLSGWVELGDASSPEGVRLELTPRLEGSSGGDGRLGEMRKTALADRRGFFQLFGLPPGSYSLTARKDGFAVAERPVRLVEEREARLLQPLVLQEPASFEVHLDPPVDPIGDAPWQVGLYASGSAPGRLEERAAGPAAVDGTWASDTLAPGRYLLRISGDGDREWWKEEIEIAPGSAPLFVSIPLLPVTGRVRLGDQPLAARLAFSSQRTADVELESDESGRFDGYLTEEGWWMVDIAASDIDVQQKQKLQVTKVEGRSHARIDLRIPDTEVYGQVSARDGTPVVWGFVVAIPEAEPDVTVMKQVEEEGRFSLRGLPEGPIRLSAQGRTDLASKEMLRSEQLVVDLQEERDFGELRIIVERPRQVIGVVTAPFGPVPGAAVTVETMGEFHPSRTVSTDVEGKFVDDIPAGSASVVVQVRPHGYTAQSFRLPLDSTPMPLSIAADRPSGTLELRVAKAVFGGSDWILVNDRGGHWESWPLEEWAGAHGGEPEVDRLVIPQLEAAGYRLCLDPDPSHVVYRLTGGFADAVRCTAGQLVPGGHLTLDLLGDP